MGINSEAQFSWQDLLSKNPDRVSRTADALYASGRAPEILSDTSAADAAVQSVERGNRTAAGILLLGYVEGSIPVLQRLSIDYGNEQVKLKPWSRTVPLHIAATAALARAGDSGARLSLLENAPQYDEHIRVFLLDILAYLDAPAIWHQLSSYLNDPGEIPEGVPTGADRRRLCDHAVDAFVDLLDLPVSFQRNPGGRYTDDDISETLRLFRQTVPR